MKFNLTLLVLISCVCTSIRAQEIKSSSFGKGIFNITGKDSTWTMKIGARVQTLAISIWPEGQENESSFLIRRSRLKFDGFAYSTKLQYKIELGLSNNDLSGASEFTGNAPRYILDAVVRWNFYENFELWFGQTKLPGNRERVISSANMQMVDRSLLNDRFNIDRDIGMQLHHTSQISEKFILKEIVAFSQGEGRNITTGNLGGHQYTAKLEAYPFGEFVDEGDYSGSDLKREKTPKLAVAVAYDYNENAVKTRSNQGSYMANDIGFYETNISTIFVDAMFKYQGFSFMAEYADRSAEDPFAKNSDGTLTGDVVEIGNALNLQSGYLFKNNWEIAGRYTNVDLDKTITDKSTQNQYTFAVSKYIVGHKLKVQSDISHLEIPNGTDELMYRLQFEIHF